MDYRLEQVLNGSAGHHAGWDALMRDVATWSVPLFIGIVAAWFLVGWIRGLPRERQGALTALIAAGGALLVNQVVSHLWERARPADAHPGHVHLLLSPSSDPSFPSDHAAAAFAIATLLMLAHRRLGIAALALAALVGIARIYAGAHYPGDILGGALVGVGVAFVLVYPLAPLMERVSRAVDWIITRLRLPLPDRPRVPATETTGP